MKKTIKEDNVHIIGIISYM